MVVTLQHYRADFQSRAVLCCVGKLDPFIAGLGKFFVEFLSKVNEITRLSSLVLGMGDASRRDNPSFCTLLAVVVDLCRQT